MPPLLSRSIAVFAALPFLVAASPAAAQLGDLIGQVKREVERELVGGGDAPQEARSTTRAGESGGRLRVNQGSSFTPGRSTLVADDFASAAIGSMPQGWKTNGSGSAVSVDGLAGRWLSLQSFATYKLKQPPRLPDRFTIEFDIVVAADSTKDLSAMPFGFTADNSVRSYVQDAHNNAGSAVIDLNYGGSSTASSSATGYYHSFDFDYRPYANRVMSVAIAVDGDMMRTYLDGKKIADSRLFDGDPARYFFISAPIQMRNGANVLFGNFRIAS